MPVAVDTPFCLTDQTTFMTVVGKHKPRWGERREDVREVERGERGGGVARVLESNTWRLYVAD